MTPHKVVFVRQKDTTNTVRYAQVAEPGDPKTVPYLYVMRFLIERLGNPERLVVTIQPEG